MNATTSFRRAASVGLAVAALAMLWPSSAAEACSTPVYRYAMYNWPCAPYRVFYFHRGEPAKEVEAVHKLIEELGETGPDVANIFVSSVNLNETPIDKLPAPVKEAFEAHEDGEPAHLVFTPWAVSVFSGQLDKKTVKAMVESPARKRIAELLQENNAAVLLYVPGADKKENAKVEKEIAGLIKMVDDGEIYLPDSFPLPPVDPEEGEEASEEDLGPSLKVATLKVNRDDKAEAWLMRSLEVIEPDLKELADKPMVYAVYGRGRVLEPYVGEGITADNLSEVVYFVAGACSCQVKEMNPGADLLIKWDWDKTAEVLAQDDPSLDMSPYGPYGYDEYPAEPMTDDEKEEPAAEEPAAEEAAVTEESS